MIATPRDQNFVTAMIGTLDTDGATIVKIVADPTTHKLSCVDDTTGSDHGPSVALRDVNNVPVLLATSSLDGETIVPVYADANGNLLIDSA